MKLNKKRTALCLLVSNPRCIRSRPSGGGLEIAAPACAVECGALPRCGRACLGDRTHVAPNLSSSVSKIAVVTQSAPRWALIFAQEELDVILHERVGREALHEER